MGKKSSFKKIRRIASAMPVINTKHVQGNNITGTEAIASGVKEVDGKKVDPFGNYRQKKLVKVPLNHNRKMKKLYYMSGMNGVRRYMRRYKEAVKLFQQRRVAK